MRAILSLLLVWSCQGDGAAVGSSGGRAVPYADAGPDRVGFVGEPMTFSAGPESAGDLSWTFGDSATGEGVRVTHTYTGPGHFTASLEATGYGPSSVDQASVRITWPLADPPPRAATTIAQANGTLYLVMPDFDKLAVYDLSSGDLSHWDTCDEPRTVSADAERVAVACMSDDRVRFFDAGGDLIDDVDLRWGARPYGVVLDHLGDTWVTQPGLGAVAHIGVGQSFVESLWILEDMRGISLSPDGLIMTRYRSPDTGGEVLRMGSAGIQTWGLALDPGPDSDTNSRGLPNYLQAVIVRPDGRVAVFPGLKANIQRGLARDGLPLTFETTTRSDLRQISLHPDEGPVGSELEAGVFDDRGLAVAAGFSPAGDWLFVAHQGMETVDILDAYTMERVGAAVDVGTSPDGVWVTEEHLWVSVGLSRQLVRYDLDNIAIPEESLRIDLLPPEGEILDAQGLVGKQIFQRSVDPRMSSGGYLSCASCHVDGGDDGRTWDFTDRGEGIRNTPSLRGRGVSPPLHWTANFDEVQDFEGDIRGPQQGLGFLSEEDWEATSDPLGVAKEGLSEELDALAAYIASLDIATRSPYRTEDGQLTADAVAGQAIFEDPAVGCAVCHAGPSLTDSGWMGPGIPVLHDVGTLTADSGMRLAGPLVGLDTPGLRGLHGTAPYLHDGSAETLMDVLVVRNLADEHGVTSTLSPTELDRLVSYLLQLE